MVPEESLRLVRREVLLDRLVGDLRVDGLGDDVIVRTAGGRGTLRFLDGGQAIERQRPWTFGFGFGLASLEDAACRQNFERMLGARLIDPFSSSLNGLRLVEFEPGVYAAHEGGRAAYDANMVFDADRVEAAAVDSAEDWCVGTGRPCLHDADRHPLGAEAAAMGHRRPQSRAADPAGG